MNAQIQSATDLTLASLLRQAARKGEARVKLANGQVFVVKPQRRRKSPLNVKGLNLGLSAAEIVGFVREGRRQSD